MTRIEFYVLPGDQPSERLKTACQLALKAWRQGLPVFLRWAYAKQAPAISVSGAMESWQDFPSRFVASPPSPPTRLHLSKLGAECPL